MSMTRKDYVEFAKLFADLADIATTDSNTDHGDIGRAYRTGYRLAIWQAVEGSADIFADDNPRFDRERFLKACGVEVEK